MRLAKILILFSLMSVNVIDCYSQKEQKKLNLDYFLNSDKFHQDIEDIINHLNELYILPIAGNKNFTDIMIYGYSEQQNNKISIYALAICENFYKIDKEVVPQKAIFGSIEINIEERKFVGLMIKINWINRIGIDSLNNKFYENLAESINRYNNLHKDFSDLSQITLNLKNSLIKKAVNYFISEGLFEELGYLKKFYSEKGIYSIDINFVQWLVGEEAKRAANEDGDYDCCPDGYYIRNQDQKTQRFVLSDSLKVILLHCYGHERRDTINLTQFINQLENNRAYKGNELLGRFRIKNDIVESIEEQYRP